MLVAVFGSAAIALVGMTAALILTALLSAIVVAAARFTGFAVEEASR